MTRFARKKPVTIEYFKYEGDLQNSNEEFYVTPWAVYAFQEGTIYFNDGEMYIKTLEGNHHVSVGDYIIRGVNGELYPCKPDIFEKTYDIYSEDSNDTRQEHLDTEFVHDFSWALWMMKHGKKIHRAGWNGKGMFAVLQKGYPDGIPCNKQTAEAWGIKEGDLFRCEPYMQLKMVNGSHSMWVPSVNDCLSNDWAITG